MFNLELSGSVVVLQLVTDRAMMLSMVREISVEEDWVVARVGLVRLSEKRLRVRTRVKPKRPPPRKG